MQIELFGRDKCKECVRFGHFLKSHNLTYIYRDMKLEKVQDLYISNDYHNTLNNVIPIILINDLVFIDVTVAIKYVKTLLEES